MSRSDELTDLTFAIIKAYGCSLCLCVGTSLWQIANVCRLCAHYFVCRFCYSCHLHTYIHTRISKRFQLFLLLFLRCFYFAVVWEVSLLMLSVCEHSSRCWFYLVFLGFVSFVRKLCVCVCANHLHTHTDVYTASSAGIYISFLVIEEICSWLCGPNYG